MVAKAVVQEDEKVCANLGDPFSHVYYQIMCTFDVHLLPKGLQKKNGSRDEDPSTFSDVCEG
jgi:hypothetical protein